MPSLNVSPDYPEHPKTRRLIARLGPLADALPIRLWCYLARYHPANGSLRGYSPAEIEAAVLAWHGEPGAAVAALIAVGFLDQSESGELSAHGWCERERHLELYRIRAQAAAEARWAKNATSILQASPKHATSNASGIAKTNKTILNATSNASSIAPSNAPAGQGRAVHKSRSRSKSTSSPPNDNYSPPPGEILPGKPF